MVMRASSALVAAEHVIDWWFSDSNCREARPGRTYTKGDHIMLLVASQLMIKSLFIYLTIRQLEGRLTMYNLKTFIVFGLLESLTHTIPLDINVHISSGGASSAHDELRLNQMTIVGGESD